MSFSRKRDLPAVCNRHQRSARRRRRKKPVKYYLHWAYPTAFIMTVALLAILYLCQRAKLMETQYRITNLKQQRKELRAERDSIKLAVEKLESLERIEHLAVNELGMVFPEKRYVLDLGGPTSTALVLRDSNTASP